jgi:hypothetical protein
VAGKKERQRKLARERYERQQARRIQRTHRWRQTGIIVAACCAVVLLGGGAYLTLSGARRGRNGHSQSHRFAHLGADAHRIGHAVAGR